MAILLVATTARDESLIGVDFMSIPEYLNELSEPAKQTLARILLGEARKLLEAEHRHIQKPGFEEAAEHAVMSSDMHFDSVIELDNAMCFTAFGMQVERERNSDEVKRLTAVLQSIADLDGDDLRDLAMVEAKATIIERLADRARAALQGES